MKNKGILRLILITLISAVGCSESEEALLAEFYFTGRYTHELTNCDNTTTAEVNCTEFLEFLNASEADILYGGSDIIYRVSYHVQGSDLILDTTNDLGIELAFLIYNDNTLIRLDNNDIWLRVE